jgi:hypothetical protein
VKHIIRNLISVAACVAFTSCGEKTPTTKPDTTAAPVYYYDFTDKPWNLHDPANLKSYYDELVTVTALQGLVNRDAPNIFIRHLPEADDFWWEQMTKPGDWLEGREIKKVTSLDELLAAFPKSYKGLVVWDEAVPATSNVALSVAGVDDLLPVRFDKSPDSLFSQFLKRGIEPKVWLIHQDGTPLFTGQGKIPGTETASSGSTKNDAYRWLLHHYGEKVDPERISYHLDSFWMKCHQAAPVLENSVPNGDYFVAHGAIRCDLHVLDDEAPIDDPGQKPGTDLETLKMILSNANKRLGTDRMIQFAGFTPWAHKYSNQISGGWHPGGSHSPLNSEHRLAKLITSFNAYMDGDAPNLMFMANASFYQHYPIPDKVPQTAPRPSRERLIQEGVLDANGKIKPLNFYTYYTGDYDGSPWLLRFSPRLWNDPARGQVPVSWAFNPNLADRFAYGMGWLRRNATPNDFFVSGDSGAGYVNPSLLQAPRADSGLPDGMDRWAAHCQRYFDQWDLDVVGFVIDGTAPPMNDAGWDAYRTFAPGGLVVQGMDKPFGVRRDVPYVVMGPTMLQVNDPAHVARVLGSYFQPDGYSFTVMRTILVQAPTLYKQVDEILQQNTEKPTRLVDMATLLWLIREYSTHPGAYPPVVSFEAAAEVSADRKSTHGLAARIGGEDGIFEEVIAGPDQSPAWKVLSPYIYLDVDNGFARSLKGPVEAEVTYLDQGTGDFVLQYDQPGNPYQLAAGSLKMENSGEWRSVRFHLPDPAFKNSQNGGADLRINNRSSQPLVIRGLKIIRPTQ